MVEVEEGAAEEEERRDHEAGEEGGDLDGGLAGPAEQEEEDGLAEEDDDHERRERAERVDVVGARQLDRAPEGRAKAAPLEEDGRHGEPEEREPREPRKDERARQQRHRGEDEHPGRERAGERAAPLLLRDEDAGGDVGDRHEHRPRRDEDEEPLEPVKRRERDDEDRGRHAERERGPEAPPVEANRLGDELSDRPRLGRKRRRELTAGAAPRHQPQTLRTPATASRTSAASTCARVSGTPWAGHSQTKVIGPGGGSGQIQ